MKIHEYQAKQLFAQAQVPVPRGVVARTPDEAAAAFTQLGTPVAVVKSQIHAGGRGKGTFQSHPSQRGVVLVRSADEARQNAARMLGQVLVTKQTGPEGKQVNTLLVEQGLDIAREPPPSHRG
jgi:succinyl-CoA synthetase beta subunit